MKRALPIVAALAGCTFTHGTGWVTLEAVELEAAFVPGEARDLGDGAVLTDLAYTVTLEELWLGLDTVALQELQGGSGDVSFDPADPPEGYGLCHNGHCHHEDGRLVSYDEIEAELAGGNARWVAVAELPIDAEVDLLAGELLTLDQVLPSAELPLSNLGRLELGVTGLQLLAEVTGEGLEPIGLSAELSFTDSFTADLDLPIDRDQAESLGLELALEPGGDLFDELDFELLADEGVVQLRDPDDPGAATLLAGLLDTPITITITEHPSEE
jgi:hypothetical protein